MNAPAAPPGSAAIRRGVARAAAAALLFGATAPLLKRASAGVGALAAGALLYLGAALGAGALQLVRGGPRSARLPRALAGRVLAVALVGGAVAPALLVWGLARTDASTAALLLSLEAPFTLLLAWIFLRERLGGRVLVAASAILAGGAVLIGAPATGGARGAWLVAAAALGWAVDNLLSRRLADHDPLRVVWWKGLAGGLCAALAALAVAEPAPPIGRMAQLIGLGVLGYGVSLQLYLRSQRLMGAARTASVFAAAPFAGVVAAFALGATWPGWPLPVAAALIGVGLALHVTERHAHAHDHPGLTHDHPHQHADGHHHHPHDPMPAGPHSHPHQHDALTHDHPHGDDLHHRHDH